MTRLPDAEIDEIIGRAESDAIAKRFILLALEVRERRAAERAARALDSEVEQELKEAAATIDSWAHDGKFRLEAYYYAFDPTGERAIDRVLSAVAIAGKQYHLTEDWTELPGAQKQTPARVIQLAAHMAAAELAQLRARVGELEGEVSICDKQREFLER